MTGLALLPADGAPLAVQPTTTAPALPVEGHIVAATRAAEAARNIELLKTGTSK